MAVLQIRRGKGDRQDTDSEVFGACLFRANSLKSTRTREGAVGGHLPRQVPSPGSLGNIFAQLPGTATRRKEGESWFRRLSANWPCRKARLHGGNSSIACRPSFGHGLMPAPFMLCPTSCRGSISRARPLNDRSLPTFERSCLRTRRSGPALSRFAAWRGSLLRRSSLTLRTFCAAAPMAYVPLAPARLQRRHDHE